MDGSVTMSLNDYNDLLSEHNIIEMFKQSAGGSHEAVYGSDVGNIYISLSQSTVEKCYRTLFNDDPNVQVNVNWK